MEENIKDDFMKVNEFLDKSLTAYHAVKFGEKMLKDAGFVKLDMKDKWNLEKHVGYYVTEGGTSLFAFKAGENHVFNIVGSHTDSPALKVKGNKLVDSAEGKRLNVEKYGGLLLYSFLDAPLKVAGRIAYLEDGEVKTEVVESGYNVVIPSLAIHHNPDANTKLSLSVQKDMLPLIGDAENVYSTLSEKNVVDADLFVVPAVPAFSSGVNNEFLCAPRLDNLLSVFASISAVINSTPKDIAVCCCFDNEEVGSGTKQGAESSVLSTLLLKINRAFGKNDDDFICAVENGFLLSADNAHAVHPANPDKSDVTEKVYLNKGVVIKRHTNYSTDALSSAVVKSLLKDEKIEAQDYYNNSDIRCGSTIGLVTSANLNMTACDVGIAQLAMHSGVETVGASDVEKMQKFMTAFMNAKFSKTESGVKIN